MDSVGIHSSTRRQPTTFIPSFFHFFIFFFFFLQKVLLENLGYDHERLREIFSYSQSGRNPFKVMAEGSSSSSPVPTPKENASLLRPWFPDHPSAALHPTETIRVMVEYRSMHILQFLWLTRRKGWKLWGLLPHQRMVSSKLWGLLPHQRMVSSKLWGLLPHQ
jgi:hypothetical protein